MTKSRLARGTVAFLFTDIEGSTTRWQTHGDAMGAAVARHDALLRREIEIRDVYVFKTVGDAFCAAFPTAPVGPRGGAESRWMAWRPVPRQHGQASDIAFHHGEQRLACGSWSVENLIRGGQAHR